MRSSLYGFSSMSWKRGISHAGIRVIKLDFLFMNFPVRFYSVKQPRASRLPKVKPEKSTDEERDAFYVVRKGNMIGIYKSLSDCQAQASSSVLDPPVSVYKGHRLQKETVDYLASRGLANPLYTVDASDLKEELFGTLVLCPFQQPDGLPILIDEESESKSSQKISEEKTQETDTVMSCTLEYDGASKGNPGRAGAGAILRAEDGRIICRLRQGLGVATNNVAEYRALILGLNGALEKGYKHVIARGDSKLVCKQVQGTWRVRNQNMGDLCKVAKEIGEQFSSFQISHVKRAFNSDADAEANLAVDLPCDEIYEET